MFFIKMFMMHFMGSTNSPEIPVVTVSEYFESLMNKNIVHHKVTKTIKSNPYSHKQTEIVAIEYSKKHQQATWKSEDDKKGVISFKKAGMPLVMITMKDP